MWVAGALPESVGLLSIEVKTETCSCRRILNGCRCRKYELILFLSAVILAEVDVLFIGGLGARYRVIE